MSGPARLDQAFASSMRQISRAHIADIWRRGQKAEALSQEDLAFYESMLLHPEYAEVWERAGELADRDLTVRGVNPFLHISLHAVIARQIAEHNPAEVEQAVFRLTHAGIPRHEALHRVANVLQELLSESMRTGARNSDETYRRRLRALRA